MSRPIELAAGFVLFRDERPRRYLLLRNARHGTWGFPKGHRDPGEDDLGCARRELLEETGLDRIEIVPGFDQEERYVLPDGRTEKVVRYFLARLLAGRERLSKEHAAGGFETLEDALALLQHEGARALLRAADRHLDGAAGR